jgi:adsorption protein B
MILAEQETNLHYEVILTHDAEDIIHPESLHLVNYYSRCYGMVQTPVLALPTPMRELVHGLYCDDFAEFHTKDMTVRQILGGFIPSSGVGTAYRRSAIEQLAAAESNRIFQPSCLTEDYENGLRLHQLGCSQAFAPILYSAGQPIATREYFPRRLRAARHQRTRWTTGIALQSWRRHGWRGNAATLYWLWRDRKGLIGNPASLLANLLLILSAAGVIAIPLPSSILAFTALLAVFHQASRVWFTGRIYGWIFALAVPVRTLLGNLINAWATFSACWNFFGAWVANRPLVWVKTEHAYPSLATLREHKRMLGEVLIATGMIEPDVLRDALAAKPANRRIGEFLVDLGRITRDELYQALGLQHGLPAGDVDPSDVPVQVARSLPLELARDLRMLAIAIEDGRIELATPDLPGDDAQERVRTHTDLEISFRLVSEENYQQLCRTLL